MIVEAMKMENSIIAPREGLVETVNVKEGDRVDGSRELVKLVQVISNKEEHLK
jgi:3-methylcrotonyl-CoA carboxylase alpha subunit